MHCNHRVNLVPRAFSSFKMAVGETPGQGCQSGSKSSLEFRHTNTMKCLRFVWIKVSDCRKQTGPPDAGNNLRKSHFIICHVTKYSTIHGVFQQPWLGVSPTAILIEEKTLGTRLSQSHLRCFFFNSALILSFNVLLFNSKTRGIRDLPRFFQLFTWTN